MHMLAETSPVLAPEAAPVAERVLDNVFWRGAAPRLSICVPAYRHDVSELIATLADCEDAGLAEIIVHDDGAADHDMLARMQYEASRRRIAVRLIAAHANRGRAFARNRAIAHARADWVLLLDADMLPDQPDFLTRYLDAIEASVAPAVIVGGYSLHQTGHQADKALHRWQAEASECIPAARRQEAPGRYVFSSNVLAHRKILNMIPFDESFSGWGWEDTDWGIRTSKVFPVVHIDNTATHLGLDTDAALMAKYSRSGENFARLVKAHPDEAHTMPLFRMARRMRSLPLRSAARNVTSWAAQTRILPLALRGRALKTWRALVYAEAL
jgi:glycosyltransferase involved in cell wall biosynthesis